MEMEQVQLGVGRALSALALQRSEALQGVRIASETALLDWPVRGNIVSHFGVREHPVYQTGTFNSGIVISAPPGTPVRAAGSGVVLFEGVLQGFGQVVIIDHGRNMSTVYAHLADIMVTENDEITVGAVIGTVGNTGTGGYSLHFEVRIGDSARNPLDYLKNI